MENVETSISNIKKKKKKYNFNFNFNNLCHIKISRATLEKALGCCEEQGEEA